MCLFTLLQPFWKVTADGSSKGNGVIGMILLLWVLTIDALEAFIPYCVNAHVTGILEANFIEPAHDKQDFERSSLFIRLETRLKQMVMEYW